MTNGKVMRREGYLSELSRNIQPKRLLFYDTETEIIEHSNGEVDFPMKIGYAIYVELDDNQHIKKRHTHKFKSGLEFVDILEQYNTTKTTLYIFAHNTGFDIRVLELPRIFNDLGYTSEPPIINNRAFIWDVKSNKGKFIFLDTANYGVQSVKQLGEDLKLPKLEINIETATDKELDIYNIRDTEIIELFILKYIYFLRDNDLGSFKMTLASQSLASYRYKFMSNKPYIHINEESLKLEREAYHGGRVECYRIGEFNEETYYNLDVNSMYPYAMIQEKLPTKLKGYSGKCPVEYLPARQARSYIIADVIINTDKPAYPILYNGKLVFPIGQFRTQLHDKELEYAIRNKHIQAVIRCSVFESAPLFETYVSFFYEAKKKYSDEGNISYRYITKLFLNSLYGKFGQTNPIREKIGETTFNGIFRNPVINIDTNEHYQEICWYGEIYKEYRSGETHFSIPALAGAITAIARMRLWQLIEIAGFGNVFYIDTDSLIVNELGKKNLEDYMNDSELGYLKLDKTSEYLKIYNCKDYIFGKEIKIKGIPSKAILLEENRWKYLQFQGFLSWLNAGGLYGAKANYIEKRRISTYKKGIITDTGIVLPYSFSYNNQTETNFLV